MFVSEGGHGNYRVYRIPKSVNFKAIYPHQSCPRNMTGPTAGHHLKQKKQKLVTGSISTNEKGELINTDQSQA